ncbi:hypothetical protein [Polaribacter sp. R77954]|uniref:hypothetical protein n=1 Tax=Polaribacter sp. R77954 TaxID=3093870 RepID=UPI0037CA1574
MKKWNLASCGIENLCGIFSQTLNLDKIENKMNYKSKKKALFTTMPIFNCCFIFPSEKYAGTKLFDFFCLFLAKLNRN